MKDYVQYKIDESDMPSLHMSEYLGQILEFCGWLNQMGIKTSNCRLSFYVDFLKELLAKEESKSSEDDVENKSLEERIKEINKELKNKIIEPDIPENEVLEKDYFQYVLREIHELMWIYKGFKNSHSKRYVELFKTIIGGQKFSRNDSDRTARNYQLEARSASYFLQAGYKVDLGVGTDVIAYSSEDRFFIERKRLNSTKKVNTRIKEAANQLKKIKVINKNKRNYFGIAVFDVTKIGYPHDGLTWGMTYAHCRDQIQNKLREISSTYNFAGPFIKNKNVILVWLQIHMPSLNLLKGHPTTRFSSLFLPLIPRAGYRCMAFERLRNVIEIEQDKSLLTKNLEAQGYKIKA